MLGVVCVQQLGLVVAGVEQHAEQLVRVLLLRAVELLLLALQLLHELAGGHVAHEGLALTRLHLSVVGDV